MMDLLPIPGVLGKPGIIITLLVVFSMDVVVLLFNRGGHIRIAGVLAILTTEIGLIGTFWGVPGGAGVVDLPLLDLLLQATVIAAALLSPGGALVLTVINGALIFLALQTPTLSPELSHLYHGRGFSILICDRQPSTQRAWRSIRSSQRSRNSYLECRKLAMQSS
jgi:hypothetical protein